jgi:hypothetical protein
VSKEFENKKHKVLLYLFKVSQSINNINDEEEIKSVTLQLNKDSFEDSIVKLNGDGYPIEIFDVKTLAKKKGYYLRFHLLPQIYSIWTPEKQEAFMSIHEKRIKASVYEPDSYGTSTNISIDMMRYFIPSEIDGEEEVEFRLEKKFGIIKRRQIYNNDE